LVKLNVDNHMQQGYTTGSHRVSFSTGSNFQEHYPWYTQNRYNFTPGETTQSFALVPIGQADHSPPKIHNQ